MRASGVEMDRQRGSLVEIGCSLPLSGVRYSEIGLIESELRMNPLVLLTYYCLLILGASIAGGMIPKVRACLDALNNGVNSTHILDGRLQHSLLLEIFSDQGIGTMILHD